jgi:hypothetical protein
MRAANPGLMIWLITLNGNANDFPFAWLAENVVAAIDALQRPPRFV